MYQCTELVSLQGLRYVGVVRRHNARVGYVAETELLESRPSNEQRQQAGTCWLY